MDKKILVVLRRRDKADEMMPYLEEVAKPGMRLVFMLPYPLESWPYLKCHWIEADTARAALPPSAKVLERYSWDAQKRMAQEKIAHLRPILQQRQVEVAVDLYTGTLKQIVRAHESDATIHLIVARAEGRGRIRDMVAQALAFISRSPQGLSVRVFSPALYRPGAPERTW
jgi:hypothetical protein